MNAVQTSDTFDHCGIRLICAFVLAVTPSLSLVASCGDDSRDQGSIVPADAGSPGDRDGDTDPDIDPLQALSGTWVVEMQTGSETTWGHVVTETLSWDGKLTFTFKMDDNAAPYLTAELHEDGTLSGVWRRVFEEYPGDMHNWQGTISTDRNTINSSITDGRTVSICRACQPSRSLHGVWHRVTDDRPIIFMATNEHYSAIILDAAGGWDGGERFGGEIYPDSSLLRSNAGDALVFAQGSRIHLQRKSFATVEGGELFERAPSQSELNGMWLGRARKSTGRVPTFDHPSVIVHDGVMHVQTWVGREYHAV